MISHRFSRFATLITITISVSYALSGTVLLTTDEDGKGRDGSGHVVLCDVGSGARDTIVPGNVRGACFSPTADQIAYSKAGKLCICNLDGSGDREVTSVATSTDAVTWAANGCLYWSQGDNSIRKVKLDGSDKATVYTTNYKSPIIYAKASHSGNRFAWWTPNLTVRGIDITTSEGEIFYGGGCRGTVSPDGSMVLRNRAGHKQFFIYDFEQGLNGELAMFDVPQYTNPVTGNTATEPCNAHRFSNVSNDYIVFVNEWRFVAYVFNIRTGEATLVGPGLARDFNPGPSVQRLAAPTITPSRGTFVDALEVTITTDIDNATIRYTLDHSEPTAESDEYTGPFTIDQTTTVTAKAFAGDQTSFTAVKAYTQTASEAVLDHIEIEPTGVEVVRGGIQQFAVTGYDQFGNEMSTDVEWSVSGGGTISADGVFAAGDELGGPFDVTATVPGTGISMLSSVEIVEASLRVTAPNTGDGFALGQTITVEWEWTGAGEYPGQVDIELSADGGLSWYSIVENSGSIAPADAGWGSLEWSVGPLGSEDISPVAEEVQIRVADYVSPNDPGMTGLSGVFRIAETIDAAVLPRASMETDRVSIGRRAGLLCIAIPLGGNHHVSMVDMRGVTIQRLQGRGPGEYRLCAGLTPGCYLLRVTAGGRTVSRKVWLAR
ncbi:MAG: hypothetical protein GF418_09605 [Chitinivibrionales bacterium]|nr:hypothetical protein [Chitinivibrionales bacterium]MBD3395865.1 hypothetical protein [Chitinivibrionales bacterium]